MLRPSLLFSPLALAVLAVAGVGMAGGHDAGSPSGAPPARTPADTWPQKDTRAYALFHSIHDRCAASRSRPLTAGSYTEPVTGVTVHWPDGWTLVRQDSLMAILAKPVTFQQYGVGPVLHGDARFQIELVGYSKNDAMPHLGPETFEPLNQSGGMGTVITLVGQPATLAWALEGPALPACPGACGSAMWPPLLDVGGSIQVPAIRDHWPNGVALRLTGQSIANAQPSSVFCDMQAMVRGVTLP